MDSNKLQRQLNGTVKLDLADQYYDDVEFESLYQWVDRIPLSRPKNKMYKDFADGVLVAEIVKYYFPRMVNLHNYSPAFAVRQRKENWSYLNRNVLNKLDFDLSDDVISALANAKPNVIEKVLMMLRVQIDKLLVKTDTLPMIKSPRIPDGAITSHRQSKSEPVSSRKYHTKGEIPHGHPDRSSYLTSEKIWYPHLAFQRHMGSNGGAFVRVSHESAPITDHVSRAEYLEKHMECQAKEETIHILHAKIRRLEHLLHLKDVTIEDLASHRKMFI